MNIVCIIALLIIRFRRICRPIDCFRRIYANEGLLSFWRGNLANITRYFPSQALNFALKDQYRLLLAIGSVEEGRAALPLWKMVTQNLFVGAAAGVSSVAVVHPFDVARTRLAIDTLNRQGAREFRGSLHCIQFVYSQGGLSHVYRGFVLSAASVGIFRSLYLGGYDILKTHFGAAVTGSFLTRCAACMPVLLACRFPNPSVSR